MVERVPPGNPRSVAWVVRLWVDGSCVVGRVIEADTRGLVARFRWLAPDRLRLGESYQLEINPGGRQKVVKCRAEVRRTEGELVGMETDSDLPW